MASDVKERFSNRVEDYVRYRPSYPPDVLEELERAIGLSTREVIADIGAGTGLSARLFLDHGNVVIGVEPNEPMRQAAARLLGSYDRFRAVDGSAEATGLPDESVNLVVAAQAFHWFDREAIRPEWKRILKPDGWVVLIWNERKLDSTPFLRAYEALLIEYGTDYTSVRHENVTEELIRSFMPRDYARHVVRNDQKLDFAGLKGRLLSSSYAPAPGHPNHEPMIDSLAHIFEEFCPDGHAVIEYDTVIHCGRL